MSRLYVKYCIVCDAILRVDWYVWGTIISNFDLHDYFIHTELERKKEDFSWEWRATISLVYVANVYVSMCVCIRNYKYIDTKTKNMEKIDKSLNIKK